MGRTWLITGASSGFGRLMTETLLAGGDRVAATVRRADALDALKAAHGDRLQVATVDVTDTAGLRRVVDDAFATLGRIDVVVSNAGYGLFGAAEELADDEIARQIATNLTGSIQLIRAVLPHLRAQGGGRILQISSEGGQIAYPGFSLYHATKWGIEGFVEAVAQEVAPFGIDVTLVEPGPTRTGFAQGLAAAPASQAYRDTPVGMLRRAFAEGTFAISGDVTLMVPAIIAAAAAPAAPRRMVLGRGAYASIHAALQARLTELEAGRDVTVAMDAPS